ncbi:MAG: hypothetical protein KDK39_18535 [Leptospiraceae bacterium]|nr:hypothetical protein [Leptospiraceae bacterium]
MRGRKPALLLCLGLLISFSGGCFDYKESLHFNADLSGYVEFQYRVPLYPEQDRSLISYFPVRRELIQERYASLIKRNAVRLEIQSIEMESVGLPDLEQVQNDAPAPDSPDADGEDEMIFRRFARVRYRVFFKSPTSLEQILPGKVQVRQRARRFLQIERTFVVTQGLADNANRILTGAYRTTRELLDKHAMQFQVTVDESWTMASNRGETGADQEGEKKLRWHLPLERTLYDQKNIEWRLIIVPR